MLRNKSTLYLQIFLRHVDINCSFAMLGIACNIEKIDVRNTKNQTNIFQNGPQQHHASTFWSEWTTAPHVCNKVCKGSICIPKHKQFIWFTIKIDNVKLHIHKFVERLGKHSTWQPCLTSKSARASWTCKLSWGKRTGFLCNERSKHCATNPSMPPKTQTARPNVSWKDQQILLLDPLMFLELFDGQHFALQRDRAERAEFLGKMDSHDIVSAFVPTAQWNWVSQIVFLHKLDSTSPSWQKQKDVSGHHRSAMSHLRSGRLRWRERNGRRVSPQWQGQQSKAHIVLPTQCGGKVVIDNVNMALVPAQTWRARTHTHLWTTLVQNFKRNASRQKNRQNIPFTFQLKENVINIVFFFLCEAIKLKGTPTTWLNPKVLWFFKSKERTLSESLGHHLHENQQKFVWRKDRKKHCEAGVVDQWDDTNEQLIAKNHLTVRLVALCVPLPPKRCCAFVGSR